MTVIEINEATFQYGEGNKQNCLFDINLQVQPGEVVLLCGPSGCGKTTVTRLINGLIPHFYQGQLSGKVFVDGNEVSSIPLYETANWVSSVFQNPRTQFFNVETTAELAFACENAGLPVEEIEHHISCVVEEMGIEKLMGRSMFSLSGGEKQQIACACVSVADPKVVVLDEPSSNLDMDAIQKLKQQITCWKQQGKAIVIAEHRIYYLQGIVDKILYMDNGRIVREYTPEELLHFSKASLDQIGLRAFSLQALFEYQAQLACCNLGPKIEFQDFKFSYKGAAECLNISHSCVAEGSITALIGRNGAGKTTFLRCLCGLEKGCKGKMIKRQKVYMRRKRLKNIFMVMQDVNHQLFTESVMDEVMLSMPKEEEEKAMDILSKLGLEEHEERHPVSLSGGQKQRVAIASAVSSARPIILFDEPTSGLDLHHMKKVAVIFRELQEAGKTLLVVTHDPEFILSCCTHVLHFENGQQVESYSLDEAGKRKIADFFIQMSEW